MGSHCLKQFVCFGRNSSVGSVFGSLSCVMQHRGFDLLRNLPVEGIFPLGLTWGLTPYPQNSVG